MLRELTEDEKRQYDKKFGEWLLEEIQDTKPFNSSHPAFELVKVQESTGTKTVVMILGTLE